MESKQELRKEMKAIRDGISEEERSILSTQIAEQLRREAWYPSVKHILVYSAIRSEVDLSEFCRTAADDGKVLYYPKVFGKVMEFYRIDQEEMLRPGAFSVMEPDTDSYPLEVYKDQKESVILVPGVSFSREGYRLGYGGGYYDRYLAEHRNLYTVGIGFSRQILDTWLPEEFDIPMKEIVTENMTIETHFFKGRRM